MGTQGQPAGTCRPVGWTGIYGCHRPRSDRSERAWSASAICSAVPPGARRANQGADTGSLHRAATGRGQRNGPAKVARSAHPHRRERCGGFSHVGRHASNVVVKEISAPGFRLEAADGLIVGEQMAPAPSPPLTGDLSRDYNPPVLVVAETRTTARFPSRAGRSERFLHHVS